MSLRLSFTLLIPALLLAGCDRQEPDTPQAEASVPAGEIDRGHAGELMPAMAIKDTAGKPLNLGALQGQPVLLNLWATWCAPCVEEMPLLDELAGDYDGKLRVVTVSQDLQPEEVTAFFAKEKLANLGQWIDKDNALMEHFGGSGVLPLTVLYDASGSEVARIAGGYDWASPEARGLVDEATSESAS